MKRNKVKCDICNGWYSLSNISKHQKTCNGQPKLKRLKYSNCPYCNISFESFTRSQIANHSRWCSKNPRSTLDRLEAKNRLTKLRENSDIDYESIRNKIKQHHEEGKYDEAKRKQRENPYWLGKSHKKRSIEKIREAALKSNHRRLVRSIREYVKKDGTIVKLDSSWEELLAKRLDYLDVEWIRPKSLEWESDDGKLHHYFPDFYLPEYNLYLDPKNPQASKVQSKKIEVLQNAYSNLIFLLTEEEIKNFSPVPAPVF